MQYGDSKKENLNRLEKKLYSRNTPDIMDKGRTELVGEEEMVNTSWQDAKNSSFDELASRMSRVAQKKQNFVKKIFAVSVIFFVIAVGIAAFVFLGGMNLVSSKNVDIKIVGPLSVGGGQEVSFDISIINDNNIDLDSASLLVEYPAGTRSAVDQSRDLDRERFSLGKIKSGEDRSQNIKAVFFGEKDNIKQIRLSLEYRVENSSALFYKEKIHEISISSAPIIITPTYPKEVNSNQDINFNIEVASNSKDSVNDFLVNVEYPFGFVFKESSPKASFGNNTWQFSRLISGEKKVISIKGNIIGQDNEERVFRINAGTGSADDERVIAIPLAELIESVLVKKPFIGIDILIEGKNSNFSAPGGKTVGTMFTLQNNLPSRLFNTTVEVLLKGGAFDRLSVSPGDNGFFQSSNDTILWDKRSVVSLSDMAPGSKIDLSYRLTPFLYQKVQSGLKPEIEMIVKVRGERVLDSGSIEQVEATEKRKIILTTDINISSKVFRSVGNIENLGPIPPKVNTPTTYTIIWSINNSFNQVSNVEVRSTLPPYVKWSNLSDPKSEIFSFNQVTNEVVWNVGSLLPNTGFNSGEKQISFQLEFLPSSSQIGQSPFLLGEVSLTGVDKVTGLPVSAKAQPNTINFSSDPTFKSKDDEVVP